MSDLGSLQDQTTELRGELARAQEREAAVRDVIQTLARTTFDLDAVLQTVIDRAVSLCHADTGNIARRLGEEDEYTVAAFTSMSPEYEDMVRARIYRPERGSLVGRAVLEKRVVHIPDVLEDPEYELAEFQKVAGYRTGLSVPMLREGVPIGVIAVARNEVRPFDNAEIRLIETFADYAVIAIENVRLFQTVERRWPASRPRPQTSSQPRKARSSSPAIGARSRRSSATSVASRRSPRLRIRKKCSACSASTTRQPESWSSPTRARSSTSRVTD